MYAVIKTGGKQYRVAAGETIKVERLSADVGQDVTLDQVVAVGSGADCPCATDFDCAPAGRCQAALTALMRISVKFWRWPWRFW